MYVTLRHQTPGEPSEPAKTSAKSAKQRVASTVILLGIVSMFTDISSESVNAVLPLYLTSVLGMSALAYGFLDGIYQGVSALVRLAAGWVADRTDHPKWVAVAGYAASALSRFALLPAHSFSAIMGVVTVDRLGKGVRTAPRDALIAASTASASLGRAFGVHRSLDTVGALIGPLMAFWILSEVPADYRGVFIASFAFAIIGLAALLLLVPDLRPRRAHRDDATAALSQPLEAAVPTATTRASAWNRPRLRDLATPAFTRLNIAAGILAVLTVGDGFLYLELTYRDSLATKYFPLLYVGTNVAYLALAIPLGRLADRVGRIGVYVAGHLFLAGCYVFAVGPIRGAVGTLSCLVLLGIYYAATDGVLPAIAGRMTEQDVRTSAIATAQTVVAVGRFFSSVIFGLLWTQLGRQDALWVVLGLLVMALPAATWLLRGSSHAMRTEVRGRK